MATTLSNFLVGLSKTVARLGDDAVDVSLAMVEAEAFFLLVPMDTSSLETQRIGLESHLESGIKKKVQGLLQQPLTSKVPVLFSETDVIQALLPGSSATRVVVVPVISGDQAVGTLNVGVADGVDELVLKAWEEEGKKLGALLRPERGRQSMHKRDLQLNLINRLGQQDVWEMDLEDFYDLAVVSIRESLDYYNVSLFMLDEPRAQLVLSAHAGAYRGRVSKGYRQSIELGILGWVVQNRRMFLSNDVTQEPMYFGMESLNTRSEICFPILLGGILQGVLNVESGSVDAFDEGDVVALEALALQIGEVLQMHRQREAFALLRAEVEDRHRVGDLLGQSEGMRKVFDLIQTVSKSDLAVLIRGETGTGKELVAKAIHAESDRKDGPFVAVNCAALPESLFESEVFGHERGAFTGADQRRAGKMELADGGTLFLDEVCEIPTTMQAKLLRAIEEQTFMRLGGEEEIQVDVRILSATNQPLEALEREGRFRRDLYFRLNAVQIHLPPLQERVEDIPLLAAHFLRAGCVQYNKQIDTIAPPALAALVAHSWPGNIRELKHVIARAVLLEETSSLSHVELPQGEIASEEPVGILPEGVEEMSLRQVCRASLEEIEREYVRTVLTLTRGNISRAAERAGITRRTLYNKLEAYGMRREDFVPSR